MSSYKKIQEHVIYLKKVALGGACVDCACRDVQVLEFDHVLGIKKYHVFNAPSKKLRIEESKKCVLRCRRCHRIKTMQRKRRASGLCTPDQGFKACYLRNKRVQKQRMVNSIKENVFLSTCEICRWISPAGYSCALDFDHLHPVDKVSKISKMVNSCCSNAKIKKEIAKCQLLCANCHHRVTLCSVGSTLYKPQQKIYTIE